MAEVECAAVEEKLAVAARRRRRWWQFTSRGLLGLVTVLAIGLGSLAMHANHARRQRAALAALGANWFRYDYQRVPDAPPGVPDAPPGVPGVPPCSCMQWNTDATPRGPAILRAVLGDDIFSDVQAICIDSGLPPGAAENLAALDAIEYLGLSGGDVQDSDLAAIGRLTHLKSLSVYACNISDAGLEQLSGLTQLEKLDLSFVEISGTGLAHLKQCKRLRTLQLYQIPITTAGAKAIGSLTSVEELCAVSDGAEDAAVNNEILASCSKLRGLASLKLSGHPVTDGGLLHLRGLPKLSLLYIHGYAITDDGLAHIATIPELTCLHLACTKITDKGLEVLRSLPSLEELGVGLCADITDGCLPYLRQIPKLRSFSCNGTQITEDGLKQIEAALPQLEIH